MNWYAVYKNGKQIFQGYLPACQRLVKNLKSAYRLSDSFATYEIVAIKYNFEEYKNGNYHE